TAGWLRRGRIHSPSSPLTTMSARIADTVSAVSEMIKPITGPKRMPADTVQIVRGRGKRVRITYPNQNSTINQAPASCAHARNCATRGRSTTTTSAKRIMAPALTIARRAQLHCFIDETASLSSPLRNSAKLFAHAVRDDTSFATSSKQKALGYDAQPRTKTYCARRGT